MGTIRTVLEDHPNYQIIQIGGYTHYTQELLCHLSTLPKDEADRIVTQLEYKNRLRRVVDYRVREAAHDDQLMTTFESATIDSGTTGTR